MEQLDVLDPQISIDAERCVTLIIWYVTAGSHNNNKLLNTQWLHVHKISVPLHVWKHSLHFPACCQTPPEMHWKMLCTKPSSSKRFKWFHLSLNEWMVNQSIQIMMHTRKEVTNLKTMYNIHLKNYAVH